MLRSMLRSMLSVNVYTCLLTLGFARAAYGQDAAAETTLKATVVESGSATACTQGKNKRTVTISSTDPTKKVPCEVHYRKESEQPGHDQVIYSASNEVSFCEVKAKAFVDKLTGMGWTCQ